jgi:hypothetical protein
MRLSKELKQRGGFTCMITTPWRTPRRFKLSFKKKSLHPSERKDPKVQAKRRRYRAKVGQIKPNRLVFVDETGVNTSTTRSHAWAPQGERAGGSVLTTTWSATTVIAAMGWTESKRLWCSPGPPTRWPFRSRWIRCWRRSSSPATWWSSTIFKGKLRDIGAWTKEHLYQAVGDALD